MIVLLLAAGVALLLLLIAGVRAFVTADPAELAQTLKLLLVGMVGAGGLLALAAAVLAERYVLAPVALALLGIAIYLYRRLATAARRAPPVPEGASEALALRLDRGTGTITGVVHRQPFAGRRLDELSPAELVALWQRCRAEDKEAARLLATYLDSKTPGWRKQRNGAAGAADDRPMSRTEAYALLGLAPGADAAAVRDAYRRLLLEAGTAEGAPEIAARLGRAKDLLLGG
jgi:hypothetical protein